MISYPSIRPEIVTFGPVAVRWYGVMYVIGYILGWFLVKSRARMGLLRVNYIACESFITHMIVSMLLGARIVYALVYNWDVYSENPMQILRVWEGGLSFHGAVLGMAIGSYIFARRYKVPVYSVLDTLAYCATPGLFFGRLGNFINAELYGRPTTLPWGMIFPTDPDKLVRHPSQIYQGLTEGLLLFAILYVLQKWLIKNNHYRHGLIAAVFGMLYGIFRFITEFAREPDKQLGFVLGPFSMGQILCLILTIVGAGIFFHVLQTEPRFTPVRQTLADLTSEDDVDSSSGAKAKKPSRT